MVLVNGKEISEISALFLLSINIIELNTELWYQGTNGLDCRGIRSLINGSFSFKVGMSDGVIEGDDSKQGDSQLF